MNAQKRFNTRRLIKNFLDIADNSGTAAAVSKIRNLEQRSYSMRDAKALEILDFSARLLGIKNTNAIRWTIVRDRIERFLKLSNFVNNTDYKYHTKDLDIPSYLKGFLDEFYRDNSDRQVEPRELMRIEKLELDSEDRNTTAYSICKKIQDRSKSVKAKLSQRKDSEGSASTAYCDYVIENMTQCCNIDTVTEHEKYMNKIREVNSDMIVYHTDCGMSNAEIIKQNEFNILNYNDRSFWVYASAQNPTNGTGYLNQNVQGLYGLTASGTIEVGGTLDGRTEITIPTINIIDLLKPSDDLQYLVKFQKVFYAITKAVGDDHVKIYALVKMAGGDKDKIKSAKTRFTGIILSLYYFNQRLLKDSRYDMFIAYLKSQAILHRDIDKSNALKLIRTSCKMCNIDTKETGLDQALNAIEKQTGQLVQFQDLGIVQEYLALYKKDKGLQFNNLDLNVVPKELEERIQPAYTLNMYRNLGLDYSKTCFGIIDTKSLLSANQIKTLQKFNQQLHKANDTNFACIIPVKITDENTVAYYDSDIYNLIYFLMYSRQENTTVWKYLINR